jgi:hypothetical protein
MFIGQLLIRKWRVNKWHGQILTKFDKSYLHYGPQFVGQWSIDLFSICPLTQRVWHYVANIIWQLFAKRGTLALKYLLQCCKVFFDQLLSKSLKCFSHIWAFGFFWGIFFHESFGVKFYLFWDQLF